MRAWTDPRRGKGAKAWKKRQFFDRSTKTGQNGAPGRRSSPLSGSLPPPPGSPKRRSSVLRPKAWRPSSVALSQCIQTAAFSDRARSTRWRLSAQQSPLIAIFPLVSPHIAHRSDCAAAVRRCDVLKQAFKSTSALDKASGPTRPDAYHALVLHELRKSALLNTRRVRWMFFSQLSVISACSGVFARSPTARPAARASPQLGGTSASTL